MNSPEFLPTVESLQNPNQPPIIYDNMNLSWRESALTGPIWLGEKPPKIEGSQTVQFLGRLVRRLGVAAGPAASAKWANFYREMGAGVVVYKTMRSTETASNPNPNIVNVDFDRQLTYKDITDPNFVLYGSLDPKYFGTRKGMGNSFGNPCFPPQWWTADYAGAIEEFKSDPNCLLILSITPTTPAELGNKHQTSNQDTLEKLLIDDTLEVARLGNLAGAEVLELNGSCGNVSKHPEEGQLYLSPYYVSQTVRRIKEAFPHIDVGLKGSWYPSEEAMRRVLAKSGLDFVTLINAIPLRVLDQDTGQPILSGRERIGVSGSFIQDIAIRNIEWAANIKIKEGLQFDIAGAGGVQIPEDVDKHQKAGATIVEVAHKALVDPTIFYKDQLHQLGRSSF